VGDQSYEEMMLGGFAVQIDPQADLDKLFAKPQKKTQVADARKTDRSQSSSR